MTKLFSIKSLACAGAAAFALTLTAAPQASAAATPLTGALKLTPKVNYSTGILTVIGEGKTTIDNIDKTVDEYVVTTADGNGIYLGTGKNASKIKYEFVTDPAATSSAHRIHDNAEGLQFDISKLIGKETNIAVALDPTGVTGYASVSLVSSPKLKASLEENDIKITVDGSEISKGLADEAFTGYTYQYKVGAYGEWVEAKNTSGAADTLETGEDTALKNAIKSAKAYGTTIYVRVAKSDKTKTPASGEYQTSPWSKEAKVKVSAKANAPKINIKTAGLTKAFEWKMGSNVEYRVTTTYNDSGDKILTSAWTTGTGKSDWSKIMADAAGSPGSESKDADVTGSNSANKLTSTHITNLVKGDAISCDVVIQVRKVATTKKEASKISIIELKASRPSPTVNEIKVVAVQSSKKDGVASAAAIAPASVPSGYIAQYSLDSGKTWKKLTSEVRLEADELNNKTVDLRLVGNDKKKLVLPSAVTTVTIPTNGTTGAAAGNNSNAQRVSAKIYTISADNDTTKYRWKEQTDPDYSTASIDS